MQSHRIGTAPPPAPLTWHPDDLALVNSQLETAILQMREQLCPTNTAKQVDPKIEEYFQFCDQLYPNDQYRYSLDYEKVEH